MDVQGFSQNVESVYEMVCKVIELTNDTIQALSKLNGEGVEVTAGLAVQFLEAVDFIQTESLTLIEAMHRENMDGASQDV